MLFSMITTQFSCWIWALCVTSCYQGWEYTHCYCIVMTTANTGSTPFHHQYLILKSYFRLWGLKYTNSPAQQVCTQQCKTAQGSISTKLVQKTFSTSTTKGLHLPKHQWGPRSTSRAAPLLPFPGKGAAKPRMREATRCPPVPLPAAVPAPQAHPTPKPTLAYLLLVVGARAAGSPSSRSGAGVQRGRAWLPRVPQGLGTGRRGEKAGPGPAHPAAGPGGPQGREAGERRGEAPGWRSGCTATFAISTEREVDSKKEGKDSYTDCNVHKKKGGAHNVSHLALLPAGFHSDTNAGNWPSAFWGLNPHTLGPSPSATRGQHKHLMACPAGTRGQRAFWSRTSLSYLSNFISETGDPQWNFQNKHSCCLFLILAFSSLPLS